jgi:hypothetical protein
MDEERELRMAQMRADIENKGADTTYKRRLADYEPWKLAVSGMVAGAALMGALVALLTLVLRHG